MNLLVSTRIAISSLLIVFMLSACSSPYKQDSEELGLTTKPPKLGLHKNTLGGWSYVYTLPKNSSTLYPDKSWLPPEYTTKHFQDLSTTIKTFTQQSMDRDGLGMTVESVTMYDQKPLLVISGTDSKLLNDFAITHQTFLDNNHAVQGLNGINNCKQTTSPTSCWDPSPGNYPWAFYLPLGMAMINQKALTYLNFPPSDSLVNADYLDNFTMKRWNQVLEDVGISNPALYNTIVDARPIAAPGSGQADLLPNVTSYFNSSGNYYDTPMINLLTDPPQNSQASTTLPVIVLGTPAREAWGKIIGQATVDILDVGTHKLPGASKATNWVASNHPDVTPYQCCPNDPNPNCTSKEYGNSYNLIPDEKIDLQASCIIQALSLNPSADPETVKAQCKLDWDTSPSTSNLQTICVQAKLDYNFSSTGQCKSKTDALAFCQYYQNNACPTGVYTCETP
ncbi:MAG: hypothetical protein ACMZ64_12160 [Oleiphilus sp.]